MIRLNINAICINDTSINKNNYGSDSSIDISNVKISSYANYNTMDIDHFDAARFIVEGFKALSEEQKREVVTILYNSKINDIIKS